MILHIHRYKDSCGTYSISEHTDGICVLKCSNAYGERWYNKNYKTFSGAKIALAKLCGGMPKQVQETVFDELKSKQK